MFKKIIVPLLFSILIIIIIYLTYENHAIREHNLDKQKQALEEAEKNVHVALYFTNVQRLFSSQKVPMPTGGIVQSVVKKDQFSEFFLHKNTPDLHYYKLSKWYVVYSKGKNGEDDRGEKDDIVYYVPKPKQNETYSQKEILELYKHYIKKIEQTGKH